MNTNSNLDLSLSAQSFFHERICAASNDLKIKLEDNVEFYLVKLLTDFINPEIVNQEFETDVLGTPLVFLLKKTLEAPESKRPNMYRRLGDTSLYISGFFQDYFNDKAFDINYFITMGASAYSQAALLSKSTGRDNSHTDTLVNIAENFNTLVDVVAQASENSLRLKPTEILTLYDRWNRTGSDRLRNLLLEVGITPISVPYKIAQ